MISLITAICCCGEEGDINCWYGGEASIGTPTYVLECNFTGYTTGLPTTEAYCVGLGYPVCDFDLYASGVPLECQDPSGALNYPAVVYDTCGCNGNRNGMAANCEAETVRSFQITQQGCSPISQCDENESGQLARGDSDCIQYMDITGANYPDAPYRDITLAGTRQRSQESTTAMYYVGPTNTLPSDYGYVFTGTQCCVNESACDCNQSPKCWTYDSCPTNNRCYPNHGSPTQQQFHVADCPQYFVGYPNPNQSPAQVGGIIFRPNDMPCNVASATTALLVDGLSWNTTIFNPDGSIPDGALWTDCLRLDRTNEVMLSELTGTPNELLWDALGMGSATMAGSHFTDNWSPCTQPDIVGLDNLDAFNNILPTGTLPTECHTACAYGIFSIRRKVTSPYFQLYGRGFAQTFLEKVNPWLEQNGFDGYTFSHPSGGAELSEVYIGGTTITGSSNYSAFDKYWAGEDTAGGATAAGAMNGCQRAVDTEGKEVPLESRIRCEKEIYMWRTLQQDEIPVSSTVDLGTVTRIVEMGTTTAAQWIAMGWTPYGTATVPAFGTYFVRTTTGLGTGRVQSSNYKLFQCRPIYFVYGTGTYTAQCLCRTFAASVNQFLSPNAGTCVNCSSASTIDCCYPSSCYTTIFSPYTASSVSYSFIANATFGSTQRCIGNSCDCSCQDGNVEFFATFKTPYSAMRGTGFRMAELATSITVGDPSSLGQLLYSNLGCPSSTGICDVPCCTGIDINYG